MGFFSKLLSGLSKTKNALFGRLNDLFLGSGELDDDFYDELEEILVSADVGIAVTEEILDELRARTKEAHIREAALAKDILFDILREMVGEHEGLRLTTTPSVILVIGVNGVGKTTSIGKMAAQLKSEHRRVIVAAADTFRAAAADQLTIWAERAGADIVRHAEGADPSAVIFDAITAAKARGCDVVICDTAGRLHNKQNLMNELEKMRRVIARELPDASVETLLVLDATTGQNAISQAEGFNSVTGLTGLVITKLDGTAKGGIAIHVSSSMQVPVKYIGVGEQVDDLLEFDALDFTRAFFDQKEEA